MKKTITILAFVFLVTCAYSADTTEKTDLPKLPKDVQFVLNKHCLACHGEKKQRGEMVLHNITNDFIKDRKKWELVLRQLEDNEMPPEDKPQPSATEKAAMMAWVEKNLRSVNPAKQEKMARFRRLTNFEYQNTMRDLLGFELKLIKNLPEDPVKSYKFNNTAEYMLMGPEQIDRYKENAKRAMASAIVDPAMPKIHKTRREWNLRGDAPTNLRIDEIGVYGNRRGSPAGGMGLKSWPKTGEYRIRMKAAAILPKDVQEMPLRLVMGYG